MFVIFYDRFYPNLALQCLLIFPQKQTFETLYSIFLYRKPTMASASSTSARSLFQDSKTRLADRVQVNVNNVAAVARQITRGSKSQEVS